MSKKKLSIFILLVFLYLFFFFTSLSVGRYSINVLTIFKVFLSKVFPIQQTWSKEVETVIFNIRLPRIIASSLIGASLSVSGLVFQTIFRNPLVSPDVLGTTNASSFGASLAILFSLPSVFISPVALLVGLFELSLVTLVSSRVKNNQVLGLVLVGIMIGSIFSSLTSFVKLVADPINTLPSITYFLMGSIAGITKKDVIMLSICFFIGIIPLLSLSWRLNILSLSENEARSLGTNTKLLRTIFIISSALLVSSSVAVSGVIGWVGLVIPHISRFIVGVDSRKTIPSSIFLGASFLLLIDTISRSVVSSEIPIGILTSLIGAPFFLYLILREGKKIDA